MQCSFFCFFVSYVNATYIVETMSAANAYHKMKERREKMNTVVQSKTTINDSSLSLNEDSIDKKVSCMLQQLVTCYNNML